MIDIHVISLARSTRRASITETLDRHGVLFHIEEAVDAREMSDDRFAASVDEAAARARYGRPMTRAEAACFMSHRAVWRKVVASRRAAIVLEDDALPEPLFYERVLAMSPMQLASMGDIVLLGRSKVSRDEAARIALHEPLKRWRTIDGLRVGYPFKQWTSGAVGYWISPGGARRALEHSGGPLGALLDDWPYHRDHGGLRVAEMRPYVVWEGFETMESSIDAERRAVTRTRASGHDALLVPLRMLRTAGRWATIGILRLMSRVGWR